MIQTNQSFNIDTVGGVQGTPATVDSISNDSATSANDTTLVTNQIVPGDEVKTGKNEESLWPAALSVIAIVMTLGIGYLFYKSVTLMKSKISELQGGLAKLIDENLQLKNKIKVLEESLTVSSHDLSDLTRSIKGLNNKIQSLSPRDSNPIGNGKTYVSASISKPFHNEETIFANLQSPDQNGKLKFAIRGFSSQSSPLKMFVLEIDNVSGKGTYKVNPEAVPMIMNDLQLFNSFVKPYNFSGNPDNAKISTVKPGLIYKSGQFWIVEEALEVSIK